MKFLRRTYVRKHIWWFVAAAGLVLYFWPRQAQADSTITIFVPGGSGRAGGGATGGF